MLVLWMGVHVAGEAISPGSESPLRGLPDVLPDATRKGLPPQAGGIVNNLRCHSGLHAGPYKPLSMVTATESGWVVPAICETCGELLLIEPPLETVGELTDRLQAARAEKREREQLRKELGKR